MESQVDFEILVSEYGLLISENGVGEGRVEGVELLQAAFARRNQRDVHGRVGAC